MEYKIGVTDRISQTIIFFKNNFLVLSLPVIIVSILGYVANIIIVYFLNLVSTPSTKNYIMVFILAIILIINVFLKILVILTTYKTIKDIDNKNEIDLYKNIFYGFSNIFNLFKTYFYIFIYVFLLPILLFLAGIFFITPINEEFLLNILFIILPISIISFIYIIYMGNKSVFSVVNAIYSADYSYNNFKNSIKLTKGNLLKIFQGFMYVNGISWVIRKIIIKLVESSKNSPFLPDYNLESLLVYLKLDLSEMLNISNIFSSSIIKIVDSLLLVFIIIFTYIFYKRLLEEKVLQNTQDKEVL